MTKRRKNLGKQNLRLQSVRQSGDLYDTKPKFSVDVGRVSFDEPRASWDGYLIARAIPGLAPMLFVVENAILNSGNRLKNHRISVDREQMHSILEDKSNSGGSVLSQSNYDSSSSQRRSSFDMSSSVRSFGNRLRRLEQNTKGREVGPPNLDFFNLTSHSPTCPSL